VLVDDVAFESVDDVWVTLPFDPGLLIRTEIETFDDPVCVDWACAPVFCWPLAPVEGASAPVETVIVCDTSPSSPGLPMRTETEMFVEPPCAAVAAASTRADGSGAVTVGTVEVPGASGESACAGCAKPSAAATTTTPTTAARLRDPLKEIAVPPLSTSIQLKKYPSRNRVIRVCISLAFCVHGVHHRLMHAAADPAADLVGRHLPLVRSLARRYGGRGEGYEDLVQVASLGLVAAARRYDPARGVPFVAYAVPTIEGELRRYLRDRCSSVRVPRREQERAAALRRAATDAAQRLGREASLDETADAAGLSREQARDAVVAMLAPAPLDTLELRPSPDAEAEIESCEQRALVDELLEALEPGERTVVRLRFAGDLSQSEIARRLGTSQSSVSRVLTGALAKLRDSLGPELRRSA